MSRSYDYCFTIHLLSLNCTDTEPPHNLKLITCRESRSPPNDRQTCSGLERATATGVTGVGAAGVMFGVRLGVAVGVMGTTGGVRGAPMGGRMLEGGTGGSDVS